MLPAALRCAVRCAASYAVDMALCLDFESQLFAVRSMRAFRNELLASQRCLRLISASLRAALFFLAFSGFRGTPSNLTSRRARILTTRSRESPSCEPDKGRL
jgi:hypothetical protein